MGVGSYGMHSPIDAKGRSCHFSGFASRNGDLFGIIYHARAREPSKAAGSIATPAVKIGQKGTRDLIAARKIWQQQRKLCIFSKRGSC